MRDQIFGCVGDRHVLGEGIAVLLNPIVGSFNVRSLKWRLANDERVDDDAQRPDVHFVGVSRFPLQHLRRNVVGCPANSALAFPVEVNLGCESEVADLDLHALVDEEVSEFQVAVNDSVGVQVLECAYNLHGVTLHFQLVEPLPALEQVIQRLILANFEQDVHIFGVFKKVIELAHMLVLKRTVDFYFRH